MSVRPLRRYPSLPLHLAVVIAAASASPAALAQAALPPGVGVYVDNSISGIGEASYASSGTVTIYSAGGLYVGTSPYTYGLTSPSTMPLGLTTATLSSIGSDIPAGHATGEASATADLAGGVLRATTASLADVPFQGVGPVGARVGTTSFMQDYVTFAVASAQGADIVVTSSLDGFDALSDPYYASASARMVVSFGGSFSYYGGEDVAGNTTAYHGAVLGDFTSYSFTNETPTGFDFTGVLHVTDGERLRMSTGLYLDCSYSSCGFGNTARVGLDLPDGVSFTSDSGVFLTDAVATAPVPEPETWALMMAGFASIVSVARRRRRADQDAFSRR